MDDVRNLRTFIPGIWADKVMAEFHKRSVFDNSRLKEQIDIKAKLPVPGKEAVYAAMSLEFGDPNLWTLTAHLPKVFEWLSYADEQLDPIDTVAEYLGWWLTQVGLTHGSV